MRVFVEEFGDGAIRVELIPEDDETGEQWPVYVLRLPMERQNEILDQLR